MAKRKGGRLVFIHPKVGQHTIEIESDTTCTVGWPGGYKKVLAQTKT